MSVNISLKSSPPNNAPTCKSFVGDPATDTMFRVDGHVADVSQGGGELDDEVAGQDSHHHLRRRIITN